VSRGFHFYSPLSCWLDKSKPEGEQRRIGGIVSTESKDREDEVVLARGLDFSEFLKDGWFNDNHSKSTAGPVGFPEAARMVQKGEKCPNGDVAPNHGWYAEGHLLDGHGPADDIWNFAKALSKTSGKRRLGFSIEGVIQRRTGADRKIIAKAKVRNVAITNCPVNTETGLSVLAKSLRQAEEDELSDLIKAEVQAAMAAEEEEKALTSGSGAALIPESLEQDPKNTSFGSKKVKKSLTRREAFLWAMDNIPDADPATLVRFVDQTILLKDLGML